MTVVEMPPVRIWHTSKCFYPAVDMFNDSAPARKPLVVCLFPFSQLMVFTWLYRDKTVCAVCFYPLVSKISIKRNRLADAISNGVFIYLRPAREKEAQKKTGVNAVCRGRCNRKPDKPPQKAPKSVLFRKKKRHTLKTQVIAERNTLQIIGVREAKGAEHDFKVYKDTIGNGISKSIPLDADLGYQGIEAYRANSFIPIKSSKNHQLTKREKAYNKRLARRRAVIEHINCRIKTFRCMSYPYRGHFHNRHSLRMTLICGIINYDRRV